MFTKYLKLAMVLLFAAQVAQTSFADDSKMAAKELHGLLSKMDTIKAQFDQTVLATDGFNMSQESGEFVLKRPLMFNWHVTYPSEILIVSNGVQLWEYDIDLEQVNIKKIDHQINNTPAALLMASEEELNLYYLISKTDNPAVQGFNLVPIDEDSALALITIEFKDNAVSSLRIEDDLGQTTLVDFSSVQLNLTHEDKLFQLTPPSHVDIVQM